MWLRDGSPGQGSPGSSGSRDLQSWLFCAGACAAGWGRSDACDCAQPSAAEQGRGGGQRDGAADIGAERGGPVETDGSPGRAAISSGVSGMTVSSLMGMLMPPSRPDSARSLPRMPAGREGRCAAGAQQGTGGRGPQAEGGAPDPQSRKRLQVVGKSLGSVSGGGGVRAGGCVQRAACRGCAWHRSPKMAWVWSLAMRTTTPLHPGRGGAARGAGSGIGKQQQAAACSASRAGRLRVGLWAGTAVSRKRRQGREPRTGGEEQRRGSQGGVVDCGHDVSIAQLGAVG